MNCLMTQKHCIIPGERRGGGGKKECVSVLHACVYLCVHSIPSSFEHYEYVLSDHVEDVVVSPLDIFFFCKACSLLGFAVMINGNTSRLLSFCVVCSLVDYGI